MTGSRDLLLEIQLPSTEPTNLQIFFKKYLFVLDTIFNRHRFGTLMKQVPYFLICLSILFLFCRFCGIFVYHNRSKAEEHCYRKRHTVGG